MQNSNRARARRAVGAYLATAALANLTAAEVKAGAQTVARGKSYEIRPREIEQVLDGYTELRKTYHVATALVDEQVLEKIYRIRSEARSAQND